MVTPRRQPVSTVAFIDNYCQHYYSLFEDVRHFEAFKFLHLGILSEIPRKTLPLIGKTVGLKDSQTLHHFLRDALWDVKKIREIRLWLTKMFIGEREIILCIDETGDKKKGKSTDYVTSQYIGNLGKTENGIVSVNAYGVVDGITYPLIFQIFKPKNRLKEGDKYKSKPQIAVEMIQELKEWGFKIKLVLADSLYGESGDVIRCLEKLELEFIGEQRDFVKSVNKGAIASSFDAARSTLIDWGINVSLKRVERLTYLFGKIGINLRQSKILNLELGNLSNSNVLKDQRVVIAVDGGRTKIRFNKKGRRSDKTNRHGFLGEWMEPKLLTIYVVNEQGKKIRTSAIPITNDGTYSGYQEFLKILEMYLVNLGISQAKQVLLIADGAEWIWIHIPPLLKKLKCPSETYQLLDFYHAASHLKDFADAAFSTDNERQSWFKKARKILKKGQALDLMRKMGELISEANGERCKIMVKERNYILKAYRKRLLKYNEVAARKLPLGSGAVESLIRQVVNLRMKGNSKFWLQNNAEIMLHLRCQWIAVSWDNFCDSIFNSFLKPQTI